MKLQDRLRRLLLLVPWVAQRPEGAPVDEVCDRLGISPRKLAGELDLLMMVGKPPFSPSDLVDVYIEGGRVHVDLSQQLVRPPRLTHDEALTLALGLQALLVGDEAGWGASLQAIAARIEEALSPPERERYHRLRERIVLGGSGGSQPSVLQGLRGAVASRTVVELTYYSVSSGAFGARRLLPDEILFRGGYWYLLAREEALADPKIFRLDRVRELQLVGEAGAFDPPATRAAQAPRDDASPTPTLWVGARHAGWVRERFPGACVEAEGGAVVVSFPGFSWEWISAWVLPLGDEAQALSPPALVQKIRADAAALLSRYEVSSA